MQKPVIKPKSIVIAAVAVIWFLLFSAANPVWAEDEKTAELIFGHEVDAALLLEPKTGTVLYEKNAHSRVYPASITKIMTLLLAMEDLEKGEVGLHHEVEVSSEAEKMGGSQLFLSAGDRVELKELLKGVLVGSANDAAVAVAEHLSGTEEKFVERMNQKARELGMTQTKFQNPHGIHDEHHYTTAHDISVMSSELLEYPHIHEWATIWMDKHFLKGKIEAGEVYLSNSNRMIHYYRGCDGLKTGFTDEAGHGIAATAQREGTRFLAIVKGAPTSDERYQAANTLLDYAFSHYRSLPVMEKKELVASVPVEKGEYSKVNAVTKEAVNLLMRVDEDATYEKEIDLPERVHPPLEKGETIGRVIVSRGSNMKRNDVDEKIDKENKGIIEVDLVAAWDIPPATYRTILDRTFSIWLGFGK